MDPAAPARRRPGVTLACLALAATSYALMQSLVAPALPEIQHDLRTSADGVSWIFTSYLLSASIATPIVGRLGDIHGKQRALVWVLALLALGTLLSAVATSLEVMIAGRVIQGFAGGIFPLGFGIIRDEFPRERVAGSIGMMSALMGIGGGLGTVLAGVIVDGLGYHFLFWLPLVAIVIATVGAAVLIPESPVRAPATINWGAAALLSAGLAALLYAVSKAGGWGWGSPRTLGLGAAALLTLAAWMRVELRARTPLVDMRVMRLRGVWTTNLSATLIGFGMYGSFVLIPQLVELPRSTGFGFGASVTEAGLYMLPTTVAMLIAGASAGRLERRYGSRALLVAGSSCCGLGFALLALAHGTIAEILLATALMGIGIGLAFAALANLIVQAVPADQTGVATGINAIARTVGGAFGTQIAATLLTANLVASGLPGETGFTLAFALFATTLAAGALAAAAIPRSPSAHAPEPALEPAAA